MGNSCKTFIFPLWKFLYRLSTGVLWPANYFLARRFADRFISSSVLHVSYMVHVPFHMVRILRRLGIKADYLALGKSQVWSQCDYQAIYSRWPFLRAWQEFRWFWRVVAKYEIIHYHFLLLISHSGWELPFLKRMGRKIVIHYRGCEIRDRKELMKRDPEVNICQECDYSPAVCENQEILRRRALAREYGNLFLVTTPDLKMFASYAKYIPFFAPEIDVEEFCKQGRRKSGKGPLRLIHATNQPGIEGTKQIKEAVDWVIQSGHKIEFIYLSGVPNERVLKEYASADLAIGKMKMGYYANAQIESMLLGVPTIIFVHPEFITSELRESGFILTTLQELPETLAYYCSHPEKLEEKRQKARESILKLHNNENLARSYIQLYAGLRET